MPDTKPTIIEKLDVSESWKPDGIIPSQSGKDTLTGVVGHNKLPCNNCSNYTLNVMTGWVGRTFHIKGACTECGIEIHWQKPCPRMEATQVNDLDFMNDMVAEGLSYVWKMVRQSNRKKNSKKLVYTPTLLITYRDE